MSKKEPRWPSGEDVEPISCIPDNPKDIASVVFGAIHYPYIGQRIKLSNSVDAGYRVDAILRDENQVRLARDDWDGPWTMSYFLQVPLSTWWDMTMRRALGISGGSVDSWKVALDAINDPIGRHTSSTSGSLTCHVYEIIFSGTA